MVTQTMIAPIHAWVAHLTHEDFLIYPSPLTSPILLPCFRVRRTTTASKSAAKAAERASLRWSRRFRHHGSRSSVPLCGEHRRYLPTEVFQGRVSYEVTK